MLNSVANRAYQNYKKTTAEIQETMQNHQPYEDIDYEDLENHIDSDSDNDHDSDIDCEYASLRPSLLELYNDSDNEMLSTNNY